MPRHDAASSGHIICSANGSCREVGSDRRVVMSDDPGARHDDSQAATPSANGPGVAPQYVVGIGASAGGLDPLVRFFDNLPRDTGMAFVIVQHLSPDFKSLMDELLARHTLLPIHLVEDGMPVEADHVYLIPANK
jgi:two-component system CheB/CheR fusion protein